jgi:putative ABC transport system substrate-binding protein
VQRDEQEALAFQFLPIKDAPISIVLDLLIMQRRKFLALLGASTFLLSPAIAQPAKRRVGILIGTSDTDAEARNRISGFILALSELGWIDGLNVEIIKRFGGGRPENLASLASDLVAHNVDVIVTEAAQPTDAAQKATAKTPIVMSYIGDALASGYVASLARPGGNVTGQTLVATDQAAKRLELISKFLPKAAKIAILSNLNASGHKMQRKEMSSAAPHLGIELDLFSMTAASEIDTSLRAAIDNRAQAIITMEDPMVESARKKIVDFASANRIPVMGEFRPMTEAGGLMNYGPNQVRMWARSAAFVDKILKGANPGNLPIEQPVKFELIINMKTAKSLNLDVPGDLLVAADDIIE